MDLIKRVWSFPFNSPEWKSGFLWLAWGVLGGLLPLWGTASILWLFGKPIELYGLLKNGEFVLYASSFIGGAMYVIRRDIFPSKNTLTISFFILLAISLLIFVAITVTGIGDKPTWLTISETALENVSIFIIVISTALCLFVTVADVGGAAIDVPDALKSDERALERAFDQLLKNKGSRGESNDN